MKAKTDDELLTEYIEGLLGWTKFDAGLRDMVRDTVGFAFFRAKVRMRELGVTVTESMNGALRRIGRRKHE